MADLRTSIDELIALKAKLRHYAPEFSIDDEQELRVITKAFKKAGKYLIPIFRELKLCGDVSVSSSLEGLTSTSATNSRSKKDTKEEDGLGEVFKTGIDLVDRIKEDFVFVGSNSVRDKLKKLDIQANKIISAGGPVSTTDLKELNPKIPDKALENYQKKIDTLFNKMKDIVSDGGKIYFAMGINEENDHIIEKRLPEIEKAIGGKLEKLFVQNWDEI